MTYETLLKFKKIYEETKNSEQLKKVLKNLEKYSDVKVEVKADKKVK